MPVCRAGVFSLMSLSLCSKVSLKKARHSDDRARDGLACVEASPTTHTTSVAAHSCAPGGLVEPSFSYCMPPLCPSGSALRRGESSGAQSCGTVDDAESKVPDAGGLS